MIKQTDLEFTKWVSIVTLDFISESIKSKQVVDPTPFYIDSIKLLNIAKQSPVKWAWTDISDLIIEEGKWKEMKLGSPTKLKTFFTNSNQEFEEILNQVHEEE